MGRNARQIYTQGETRTFGPFETPSFINKLIENIVKTRDPPNE